MRVQSPPGRPSTRELAPEPRRSPFPPRVSPATTPQLPLCRLGDPLAPLLRAELPPAGSGPSAQQPHGR